MKKVGDIMSKSLVTVTKETTIDAANNMMAEKNINHVLVTEGDGSLIGIVSDRDTKKFISPFVGSGRETPQDKATLNIKVEKIMKKNLVTVTPEDTVKAVIEKMLQKAVHAVPVVEVGSTRLKGIITTTNILKWALTEI